MSLQFNGETLTSETVQAARQFFANNARACIAEARAGVFFVNDLERYVRDRERDACDALAGGWDHSFTFRQHAYFIQTGKSVPLFNR